MRNRQVAGLGLAITTVVVLMAALFPGFAVPALLLGGALILMTWLASQVPVPAMEIVSWGAALALGAMTVMAAALGALGAFGDGASVGDDVPWWTWALFIAYEVAIAATVGGAAWHVARHVRVLRHGSHPIR